MRWLWAALLLWQGLAQAAGRDVEPLVQALQQARDAQGVAGVSFAIVTADEILWEGGLGVRDWVTGEPVTGDTLFRIGSLTKAFTAAAMLQLQERGRLRLTDAVRAHAPAASFTNPWEASHPVTIAQLLEHAAGLQDLTKDEFDSSDPKPLSLDEGLALRPDSRTLRWQPGLHHSYSNAGYGLAGHVIEQVSGLRYEDVVQAELFDPLQMGASGFFLTDTVRSRLATGYQTNRRTPRPLWHMIMRPFGGIHSSAHDMTAFLRMLLNQGRHADRQILSVASMQRMETPTTSLSARSGLTFGYGLGVYPYFQKGFLLHGHSGDADGYLSFFGYSRALNLAYFISINAFDWDALYALRGVVEEWMVQGAKIDMPTAAVVPAQILQSYVGRYEPATQRSSRLSIEDRARQLVSVSLDGGVLRTHTADGTIQALQPVSETHFRRDEESVATSAFVRGDDGKLYFQDEENYVKVE